MGGGDGFVWELGSFRARRKRAAVGVRSGIDGDGERLFQTS